MPKMGDAHTGRIPWYSFVPRHEPGTGRGAALSDERIDALADSILQRLSVEQLVGQLFLVTFQGNDTGPDGDIARLIQDRHVGGVVLMSGNGNFRNDGDTPIRY